MLEFSRIVLVEMRVPLLQTKAVRFGWSPIKINSFHCHHFKRSVTSFGLEPLQGELQLLGITGQEMWIQVVILPEKFLPCPCPNEEG